MLIDGLCQAYHWSFADAKKLTIPQIIMMNHAAHINNLRSDERVAAKEVSKGDDENDPIVWQGKRASELTPEEQMIYFSASWD